MYIEVEHGVYVRVLRYSYLYLSPPQGMASELNMYESQVVEYRMDIDRLQRELQEVKKKYYLQKKKEHTQRYVNRIDYCKDAHRDELKEGGGLIFECF